MRQRVINYVLPIDARARRGSSYVITIIVLAGSGTRLASWRKWFYSYGYMYMYQGRINSPDPRRGSIRPCMYIKNSWERTCMRDVTCLFLRARAKLFILQLHARCEVTQ